MGKVQGAIEINISRCKGCLLCIEACPQQVIVPAANKVNASGYGYVVAAAEDKCIGCAACGIVCPDGCITVYKLKND